MGLDVNRRPPVANAAAFLVLLHVLEGQAACCKRNAPDARGSMIAPERLEAVLTASSAAVYPLPRKRQVAGTQDTTRPGFPALISRNTREHTQLTLSKLHGDSGTVCRSCKHPLSDAISASSANVNNSATSLNAVVELSRCVDFICDVQSKPVQPGARDTSQAHFSPRALAELVNTLPCARGKVARPAALGTATCKRLDSLRLCFCRSSRFFVSGPQPALLRA